MQDDAVLTPITRDAHRVLMHLQVHGPAAAASLAFVVSGDAVRLGDALAHLLTAERITAAPPLGHFARGARLYIAAATSGSADATAPLRLTDIVPVALIAQQGDVGQLADCVPGRPELAPSLVVSRVRKSGAPPLPSASGAV